MGVGRVRCWREHHSPSPLVVPNRQDFGVSSQKGPPLVAPALGETERGLFAAFSGEAIVRLRRREWSGWVGWIGLGKLAWYVRWDGAGLSLADPARQ